jgi:hypothetical protein
MSAPGWTRADAVPDESAIGKARGLPPRRDRLRTAAGAVLRVLTPVGVRRRIRQLLLGWPLGLRPVRRVSPASPALGLSGTPLDRYYIEGFLQRHATDVHGRVLEVGDDAYTRRYGGSRVSRSDVLHVTPGAPKATIIADLTAGEQLPSEAFDCIIATQTLQMIFDLPAAVHTLYRILAPSGTILVTLPAIAPISRYDMDRWGDFWRFSNLAARRLFETVAPPDAVTVEPYGNLRAALAFLVGLGPDDVGRRGLDARDADYEVLVGVRVAKPASDARVGTTRVP